MSTLVSIIAVIAVPILVDQLFLLMERKGHIYWRKNKPTGSVACNALHEMKSFFEPQSRAHLEMRADETTLSEKEKIQKLPYQY